MWVYFGVNLALFRVNMAISSAKSGLCFDAGSAIWAAQRVPDDHVAVVDNMVRFTTLIDQFMALFLPIYGNVSPGLVESSQWSQWK